MRSWASGWAKGSLTIIDAALVASGWWLVVVFDAGLPMMEASPIVDNTDIVN